MTRKTALITGGSSGLGFELAKLFARDGYNLVLVARQKDVLDDAAKQLENTFGINVITIVRDLCEPKSAHFLANYLDEKEIQVDALVNNAGFGIAGSFTESSWERQEKMLALNINTLTELCHIYGSRMASDGNGSILNIASIAAYMAGPYMATYYASKSYVESFTEALHSELRKFGVHVCALCPPPTKTNFFYTAGFGSKSIFNRVAAPAAVVAKAGYLALKANHTICNPDLFVNATNIACRILPRCFMRGIIYALQAPSGKK